MTAGANRSTARAKSADATPPPMPAAQFRGFVDGFARLGYDVDALLAELDVDRGALADPDRLIPCETCAALFANAIRRRPIANVWTRLAVAAPEGAPLLDYLVATSDTVGDGCRQLARHLRLAGAPTVLDIHDDEDPIRIVHVMEPWTAPASVEYGIAVHAHRLRGETNPPLTLAYASFAHEPDDAREIETLLGCPVRSRAAWSGVALSRDAWQMPFRRRDPILHRLLEDQAETLARRVPSPDPFAHAVGRAIASHLTRGDLDVEAVARHLGTSSRTLQRRLSESGLTYQDLVERVRRQIAERCMLESSLSIAEIAYVTGYSEPAAFHRAFKRWTGETPQAFRQQRQADRRR